jgi:hypothetical protein
MPERSSKKRPADLNQLAASIVGDATSAEVAASDEDTQGTKGTHANVQPAPKLKNAAKQAS